MEFSEAVRGASHDQVRAAQADVVAILGAIAREPERWSRIDERMHVRIEAQLERVLANATDDARVCPHARKGAFDRAPRPLVLDAARGILACWEGCYWQRLSSGRSRGPVDPTCFDCGRRLDRFAGQDLFVAYGPILVVGPLCARCRGAAHALPAPEHDPRA
jgi:hypothetical protein